MPTSSMDIIDQLQPLALELEGRVASSEPVEIISYVPAKNAAEWLTFPGTVTLLLSRERHNILKPLRKALINRDDTKFSEIVKILRQRYESRKDVPLTEAVSQVLSESSIGEIRYFGSPVARSLIVPNDLQFCSVTLPYNGGPLGRNDLTLVQFTKNGKNADLECLAIRHQPTLTESEASALRAVPRNVTGRSTIGAAFRCWAITAVGIAATVVLVTSFCPIIIVLPLSDPVHHLNPREIQKLGSGGTARELLRLRREALLASIKK
jgi:hypothetical protein